METICPACGKKMKTSTEEFSLAEFPRIVGVEHQVCSACGEMAFTAEQTDILFGYMLALRQIREKRAGDAL